MAAPIRIKQGNEQLVSHSGLILTGMLLNLTQLKERLERIVGVHCVDPKFSHADILFSMIGLISIGKPDFDAIEIFRPEPDFFIKALGISGIPSSPTLRQRIDLIGSSADGILKEEALSLVSTQAPAITAIDTSVGPMIPLDIDVSPFDNSKTQKEGVSRTYKGCDGYAPIFGYLGREGYMVNLELRVGSQHCQKDTPQFVIEAIDCARRITSAPILMRLDSGNDSHDNFPDREIYPGVEFIIKRNLRKEPKEAWLALAEKEGEVTTDCDRKKTWRGKTMMGIKGQSLPYPIFYEVTERYMDKKGQRLVVPEIEVDTYWCTIDQFQASEVIELYHDHGTSEQFHAELKSELGLERLPSSHFASNSLILHLGMLGYNMLRLIGQHWVAEQDSTAPVLPTTRRKAVKRRRIRTVMQDLFYIAGRLIKTGGQYFISFGKLNPFAGLWERIAMRLRGAPSLG